MLINKTGLEVHLGDRTAKAFLKHLEISNIGELLEHYPRRYSHRGLLTPLASLPLGEVVTVVAEVVSVTDRRMRGRSGSILEVVVTDGSAQLTLAFFNQAWRQKEISIGARGMFSGRIGSYQGRLQLAHPDYELFDADIPADQAKAWAELPIPIYSASGSLPSWKIQKSIEIVLDSIGELPNLLPEKLLSDRGLIHLDEALRKIHRPAKDSDWQAAQDSLRFHEAMLLQLEILRRRAQYAASGAEVRKAGRLLAQFDEALPFNLTAGQIVVSEQIEQDLASGKPMHRLLQGEVGSGKTLVALRTVLTVAETGGQSALLAPTEVLATQHYQSILEILGPELSKKLGVRLLTGQLPLSEKKRVLLDLASSKSLLVIGTHALISDNVQFFDLALVVIDEQHRFGVGQREALRLKGKTSPHTLTMTATPIPRTLAITVFGDLEISTLRELPAGRQGVATHVVPFGQPALVARVWQRVAEEIAKGRQAFVVCPRIEGNQAEADQPALGEGEEDPDVPAAAAAEIAEALRSNPALSGSKIGLLHGRLANDEKSETMRAFAAGEINLLVATTVIEVGVNVPNATAMVVLDADHFGISQLHQLRGRIGRGEHPGVCLLVSAAEPNSVAMARLDALAASSDGFELSEIDLELRGEGDVLGAIQSGGRSSLKLLRVIRDAELIIEARDLAQALIDAGLGVALESALNHAVGAEITKG